MASGQQSDDLSKAIGYYERYLKLPDSRLGGVAAKSARVNALIAEATIYGEQLDYKGQIATYERALKIQPGRTEFYLSIANAQINNGDRAAAIKTYQKFLALDPSSQYAAQVKSALAQLQATASPSPSPTAS